MRTRNAIILAVLFAFSFGGVTHAALPPPAPLPPRVYDPNPGPYVVFFDQGEMGVSDGADAILDKAVREWRPLDHGIFVLCYDSAREGRDGLKLKLDRMNTIRAELVERGARHVLFSDWDCYHRDKPLPSDRARMAIVGVFEPQ